MIKKIVLNIYVMSKNIFLSILIFVSIEATSQTNTNAQQSLDSTRARQSAATSVDTTKFNDLLKKMQLIIDDKKENEFVGILKLRYSHVRIYKEYNYKLWQSLKERSRKKVDSIIDRVNLNPSTEVLNSIDKIAEVDYPRSRREEIDSVEISITEGVINHVRVVLKNDLRIFETESTIPLLDFHIRAAGVRLQNVIDGGEFINLNEVLMYLQKHNGSTIPDDAHVVLRYNKFERGRNLYESVDLNSNIEFKIFSDLLGMFGQASNGLVQTELSSRFPFFNIYFTRGSFGGTSFLSYMEPSFKYSRFDDKFSSVPISASQTPYIISSVEQLRMNQQSFINLGLKVNYLKLNYRSLFIEFNFGFTYDFVNVLPPQTQEKQLSNMFGLYGEWRGGIFKSKNFGLTYSFQYLAQRINVTQLQVDTNQTAIYIKPNLMLYYNPKGNASNRIFLRFQAMTDAESLDSFSTLQLGYTSKLSISSLKK